MEECDRQYNKAVKSSANFDLDKRSYCVGYRTALEWAKSRSTNMIGCKRVISISEIEKELGDT